MQHNCHLWSIYILHLFIIWFNIFKVMIYLNVPIDEDNETSDTETDKKVDHVMKLPACVGVTRKGKMLTFNV